MVAGLSLPMLLVGGLLTAAGVTYVLRAWEKPVTLAAAGFAAVTAFWLWGLKFGATGLATPLLNLPLTTDASLERLGFTLRIEPGSVPILVASLLLVASAFVLAVGVSQGRTFVSLILALTAGYVTLALLATGPLAPPLVAPLFLAALTAVGIFVLQAGRLVRPSGPLRSLLPPVLAFPLFLVAAWYIQQMPLNPQDVAPVVAAAQLLALGMIVLMAPFPLHGAQPATAQAAPPVVTALLTLLYQLTVLYLLYRTLATFPFVPQGAPLAIWLTWAGLLTTLFGGLAAAGANHAGRLWGYSALHDWGLILLVLPMPGIRSWPLVLFLFGLRTVSMLTAAAGLSVLEQHAQGLDFQRLSGAGTRLPWNSAAFLLGGLGLAGFPLAAGFTGHWAAIQVVAQADWRLAALVLLASGGAIFGYIRAARVLFGPLGNPYLLREQPINVALAVIALLLSIGLALAPQLLDGPIGQALLAFSS